MAAPASSPSAPLGVVMVAENARVGMDTTYSGATVYDGDRLQTPGDGTLRVRFGAEQMVLRPSTDAQIHTLPNGFSADLHSGTLVASSTEGQTFQVLADGATIRPVNEQPASIQVTMVTPKVLLLTSMKGNLKLSMGAKESTLEAGNTYRMEVAPEDPGPRPNTASTAQSYGIYVIAAVAAGATAYLIYRAVVSNGTTH